MAEMTGDITNLTQSLSGNIDGMRGARGYSAYEVAVQEGYVGTESEWLASLKGATGERGEKGDRGERGIQGIQGETGNGIASIVLNPDYTLTINFTDGSSYTTAPIRGAKGEDGHSPVVTATKVSGTTTIMVDGETVATILDGVDGHSPIITTTKSGKTTTILSDGSAIGTVEDGADGNDYVLTQADKEEIAGMVDVPSEIDDTAGAGDMNKTWSADKITEELAGAGTVQDVQVNGTSVVTNGVAEIPVAQGNTLGVIKIGVTNGWYGIKTLNSEGVIGIQSSNNSQIKAGSENYRPITPYNQHESTFYGLAKAAGDTTQSASSNTIGNYTDNAKSAIKAMLGIGGETQTVQVSGTTPTITANQNTRYVCGEVATLDFTPSASGICDVIFTSGSTATVLTLPNTVILPSWFDATALEADTTYEISISDGIYGAVMIW